MGASSTILEGGGGNWIQKDPRGEDGENIYSWESLVGTALGVGQLNP